MLPLLLLYAVYMLTQGVCRNQKKFVIDLDRKMAAVIISLHPVLSLSSLPRWKENSIRMLQFTYSPILSNPRHAKHSSSSSNDTNFRLPGSRGCCSLLIYISVARFINGWELVRLQQLCRPKCLEDYLQQTAPILEW